MLAESVMIAASTGVTLSVEEGREAEEHQEELHQHRRVLEELGEEGDDRRQHRHAVEAHHRPQQRR